VGKKKNIIKPAVELKPAMERMMRTIRSARSLSMLWATDLMKEVK